MIDETNFLPSLFSYSSRAKSRLTSMSRIILQLKHPSNLIRLHLNLIHNVDLYILSQVSEVTIGYLHNRQVKVTLDAFWKTSYKAAKNGDKAGKYADLFQLIEAAVNYSIMLHALWPQDYTGLVLLKVLC